MKAATILIHIMKSLVLKAGDFKGTCTKKLCYVNEQRCGSNCTVYDGVQLI